MSILEDPSMVIGNMESFFQFSRPVLEIINQHPGSWECFRVLLFYFSTFKIYLYNNRKNMSR